MTAPPTVFTETIHYAAESLSNAHNIVINEETDFAYIVGSNTCDHGLHMVNIEKPRQPRFAGCFAADGYTHDAQCVAYDGADREHRGREVCFGFNEDTLTIVDVTDKMNPRMISRTSYNGSGYTHQGWVTDDHLFLLLGDELDGCALPRAQGDPGRCRRSRQKYLRPGSVDAVSPDHPSNHRVGSLNLADVYGHLASVSLRGRPPGLVVDPGRPEAGSLPSGQTSPDGKPDKPVGGVGARRE